MHMAVPGEGVSNTDIESGNPAAVISIGQLENRRQLDIPLETAPDGSIGLDAYVLRSALFYARDGDLVWVSSAHFDQSGNDPESPQTILANGQVVIDHDRRRLSVESEERPLTKGQFDILDALAENLELPVTRNQILDKLYGDHRWRDGRAVDVQVLSIRRALGNYSLLLATKRGVGYLLRRELPKLSSVDSSSRHRFEL